MSSTSLNGPFLLFFAFDDDATNTIGTLTVLFLCDMFASRYIICSLSKLLTKVNDSTADSSAFP